MSTQTEPGSKKTFLGEEPMMWGGKEARGLRT